MDSARQAPQISRATRQALSHEGEGALIGHEFLRPFLANTGMVIVLGEARIRQLLRRTAVELVVFIRHVVSLTQTLVPCGEAH